MLMRVFFAYLHGLVHGGVEGGQTKRGSRGSRAELFDLVEMVFVPVVNVDGYSAINAAWGTPNWTMISRRRKNLSLAAICPTDSILTGVDLNRNYDFQFGVDEEGSVKDPCDEIFRGPSPFSEPETRAMKNLIESFGGRVSAALNFHAYGNLWIWPYNFYRGTDNDSLLTPGQAGFFRTFGQKIRKLGVEFSGNAMQTIRYPANGEASDWMLGKFGIIALSPELGDNLQNENQFYPDREGIHRVLQFSWPIVKEFVESSSPQLRASHFGFEKSEEKAAEASSSSQKASNSSFVFVVRFENLGIADLNDVSVSVRYFDSTFASKLRTATFVTRQGSTSLTFGPAPTINGRSVLAFSPGITLPKLEKVELRLEIGRLLPYELEFVFQKDGKRLGSLKNFADNSFLDLLARLGEQNPAHFAVFFIGMFLFIVVLLWLSYAISKKKEQKKVRNVVEFVKMARTEAAEFSFTNNASFRSQV